MGNEKINMFVYIWRIENYSYAWHEVNEYIPSPPFQVFATEGGCWNLKLYPRGISSSKNFTGLYLERESNLNGPVYISVDYEFSFLKSDGTPEYTAAEKACVFAQGQSTGFPKFVSREEIFETKKSIFLPDDTLTVRCRICWENIGLSKHIQAFAKSEILVHRHLFLWDAGEFNYVSPYESGIFSTFSFQANKMSLKLNEDSISVHINTSDDFNRVVRFRIGILDSNKSTSEFLIDDHLFKHEKQSLSAFLIKRSKLLQRRDLYLPGGHLVLHFEVSNCNGHNMNRIESQTYDEIFTYPTFDKKNSEKRSPSNAHTLCCANNYDSMKNDFQNLHQEETLSDFRIKVGDEVLHVHKAVLCARSSVFKDMLTSNMKETKKNMVDISDLEIDTVRRMLAFMYTDTTGDLNWDIAKRLYIAADTYDLTMLKRICTDFLKIHIVTANVEDIFVLANTHADEHLKKVASKYLQCIIKR